MSWSVTVVDPQAIPMHHGLTQFHEVWASDNPAYPLDADLALELAQHLGLKGCTLSGGRTPIINPATGGDDEIVIVTITGSANSTDFLALIKNVIHQGPDASTPVAKHYQALMRLRENPCRHEFFQDRCLLCQVHYEGGLFSFDEPAE